MFWLVLSNSTLPVTPEKFFVVARVSRIDCASLPPRLNHVGDQQNLIKGMRIDMGRILVVFRFEGPNEALHHLTLVGRVELNDADIAERRFAGLLLESEWQPDGAELDRLSAAALRYASLCESLGDPQTLAFERIGRE